MSDESKMIFDIEPLFKELGLDTLPAEERAKIAESLADTMDAKLKAELLSMLSEDTELKSVEGLSDEDFFKYFVEKKGVDLDKLLAAIALESRQELLDDVAYIRGFIAGSDNAS